MSTKADQSFRSSMFQPEAEHDSGKLDVQIHLPGMLCVVFGNGKQSVTNAARGVCAERRSFDLPVTESATRWSIRLRHLYMVNDSCCVCASICSSLVPSEYQAMYQAMSTL